MSIQITGVAQSEAWRAKVLPPVEQLRPWLWSIPVPIPNNPLRYVNVYAMTTTEGPVLIDTGWPDESALVALRAGLTAIGSDLSEVAGVLITHAHPDHYGLVAEVKAASGAWIAAHAHELAMFTTGNPAGSEIRRMQVEYLVGAGAPRRLAESSTGDDADWDKYTSMPQPDRTFVHDEVVVPEFGVRAIHTPGHSPGHACFVIDETLLVSGDHLLPRITPNITARAIGQDVPLAQYLDSLHLVRALDVAEVLPGHEYRFSGHRYRIDDLLTHHTERLDEVAVALSSNPGITTWELASQLTWSHPWERMHPGQWGFALGETLSHLDLLHHRGLAEASGDTGHLWSLAG